MKVVEVCGLSRSAGGLFYAVSSLCRSMARSGVDVSVFGKDDAFVIDDRSAWGNVPTATFKTFGPLESSFQLRGMLRELNPELVHQHGIWLDDQRAALQWQKKTGRPVVVSPHGMLDPWAVRNSAWKKKLIGRWFANEALARSGCIHALCQSEAESIRAYGLKNPIAIIPNGVELPALISDRCPPTSGEKRKLLFLGRIHPKKGLSELIEAWGKEQGTWRKDWQLLIAGWDDGNHLAGLKQQASQMGLRWSDATSDLRPPTSDLCPPSSDLCFLGPKFGADKEALLRSVDAFILPSFSEGLPMSVLEAWSYGLPVIMTCFCNIPEGFSAAAALEVVPAAVSVATGLERLSRMSDNELRRMGMNGRRLVEERFTWSEVAKDMKAVYNWCLGGDKPGCVVEESGLV